MAQTVLPFDWSSGADQADFLVSDANRAAVEHLDHWSHWPVRVSVLVGPPQSGRSLLGRIFATKSGGAVIEDAQSYPEDALFHAWNDAQESGKPVLLIAANAPSEWDVRLPDLQSRLGATPVVTIGWPDLALCEALLVRCLARRGLVIGPEVASYIALRMKRDYQQLQQIVEVLDERSLAERRAITLPFVRDCLAEGRQIDLGL